MNRFVATLATVSVLGFATAAFAQQPVQLTDGQMDTVTAGAVTGAIVNLTAFARGSDLATAETTGLTRAFQIPLAHLPYSIGVVFATGSSASAN